MSGRKHFGSMLIQEEILWFISYGDIFPALYKFDLLTKEISCLGEIPWENNFEEFAWLGKIDETLVIAPRWHKRKFIKYDINQSSFETVFLEQDVWTGDFSIAAFSNVVQLENSLFFIGNKSGLIVEYQKDQDRFLVHNLTFPEGVAKEDISLFWNSAILQGNELYLPVRKGGLLKISLVDFRVDYTRIVDDYECFHMELIGDCFWIMPYYDNKIMLFNWKLGKYHFVVLPIEKKKTPFMTAIDFGDEVLLMPMSEKEVFSIHKTSHEVCEKSEFRFDALGRERFQRQFLAMCKDQNGNTYLQRNGSCELWMFDKQGGLKKETVFVSFESIQKIFENSRAAKMMTWQESISVETDLILQIIKNNKENNNMEENTFGLNIWNDLKAISKQNI